jgi:hypothetical protein
VALLPFAQLDLPGALALDDGRYLVRPPGEPEAPADVLAVRTLGAARARGRLRRGRPVAIESEPGAEPLRLARLTLIKALPFDDEAAAERWLAEVSSDEGLAGGLVTEVVRTVNRALLAHRVAAPDPYVADIEASDATVVRFGYGSGEQVASGRWNAAFELPEARRRSLRAETIDGVGAQQRIAAVLGGRDEVAPHEALLIDAERAAEEGRGATAALILATALDSLRRSAADGREAEAAAGVAELRERALAGRPIDEQALSEALRLTRLAIRKRPPSGGPG